MILPKNIQGKGGMVKKLSRIVFFCDFSIIFRKKKYTSTIFSLMSAPWDMIYDNNLNWFDPLNALLQSDSKLDKKWSNDEGLDTKYYFGEIMVKKWNLPFLLKTLFQPQFLSDFHSVWSSLFSFISTFFKFFFLGGGGDKISLIIGLTPLPPKK